MVSRTIEAVYENGVLKPVTPLSLDEHENVRLDIIRDSAEETSHPYITRVLGKCGGRPIIRDTRIPVQTIVGYYKLGLTVDEILAGLPHLTAAQVFDALSYYHDYQAEIEADIAASVHDLQQYGWSDAEHLA